MKARIAVLVLAILFVASLMIAGDKDECKVKKASGEKASCCSGATKASLISDKTSARSGDETKLPPNHPMVDGKSGCCTGSATKASMKADNSTDCPPSPNCPAGKECKMKKTSTKVKGARASKTEAPASSEGKGTN